MVIVHEVIDDCDGAHITTWLGSPPLKGTTPQLHDIDLFDSDQTIWCRADLLLPSFGWGICLCIWSIGLACRTPPLPPPAPSASAQSGTPTKTHQTDPANALQPPMLPPNPTKSRPPVQHHEELSGRTLRKCRTTITPRLQTFPLSVTIHAHTSEYIRILWTAWSTLISQLTFFLEHGPHRLSHPSDRRTKTLKRRHDETARR